MSNMDMNVARKLGLTRVKKYWRCAGQVEIELNWLYDWILVLTIFLEHSQRVYNNEDMTQNMSVKWDIDPEWISSFFV